MKTCVGLGLKWRYLVVCGGGCGGVGGGCGGGVVVAGLVVVIKVRVLVPWGLQWCLI